MEGQTPLGSAESESPLRIGEAAAAAGATTKALRIRDAGHAPCAHVRENVADQLHALNRQIAELTTLRATVAEHYHAVTAADPAACEPAQICSYL